MWVRYDTMLSYSRKVAMSTPHIEDRRKHVRNGPKIAVVRSIIRRVPVIGLFGQGCYAGFEDLPNFGENHPTGLGFVLGQSVHPMST